MKPTWRGVIALVAAAVMATGCNSDTHHSSQSASVSVKGGVETVGPAPNGGGTTVLVAPAPTVPGGRHRGAEGSEYTPKDPPPAVHRAPDFPGGYGAIPLAVAISPPCTEHGQTVTFDIASEPGVTVVAQVKWPNEVFTGLESIRETAKPDGHVVWKVLVKPEDLAGQANLQVAVIDERPGKQSRPGSSGTWIFLVEFPGNCKAK